MTDSESIAQLQQQVTSLAQQVNALLSETAEDRQQREQKAWERRRLAAAHESEIRGKRSRVEEIATNLQRCEPWLDFLQTTRAAVQAELAGLPTPHGDRWQEADVKTKREVLSDTLLVIDGKMGWRNSSSDLLERARAAGVPRLPGHLNALEGRQMLPATLGMVEALRQERTRLQAELQNTPA